MCAAAVVVRAAVGASQAAGAADTNAPAGARGDWLPGSEWVMSSWLPYDQSRLDTLLRTSPAELAVWLDDRRTLGQLARRRGFTDLRALAARLVATRRVSKARRRVLTRRALDTLTQAHLARHVLFHVYHTTALAPAAPRVFGVSQARFVRLRNVGWSPARIGASTHRSLDRLRHALTEFFVARGRRGVALGAMSPAQARALLAEQKAGLDLYLQRRFRTTSQQVVYATQTTHGPAFFCPLG